MVYKIRSKGFWDYSPGLGHYDHNFHNFIKILVPPKDQTLFITKKNVSYMPFRYLHVYRTLKRAGNQYFQGNESIQNAFSLALRAMYARVPKEVFDRYGGWDMLVHKGERHWELMTYNNHPLLEDIFEMVNTFAHQIYGEKSKAEEERNKHFQEALEYGMEKKRERLGLLPHETLEMSDLEDIFDEVMKVERADASSGFYVRPQAEKDRDFDAENPRRVSYFQEEINGI